MSTQDNIGNPDASDLELDTAEAEEQPEMTLEEALNYAKKQKELADNYKVRAEKAEAAKKATPAEPKTATEQPKQNELSQSDLVAIIRADVADEDIEDVAEYAAFKKISVSEALKSTVVQNLLRDKKEKRTTAEIANTTASPRNTAKQTPESLLTNASSKGILPDTDEGMMALVRARKGLK